jgi:hypothetical protein
VIFVIRAFILERYILESFSIIMILVKSLIVIFLMLFVAKYFYPFVNYMANTFDGREGFANGVGANGVGANEVGANEVGANEDEKEETTYTPISPAEKQAQMASDAKLVNELQVKIAELQQLSDKATDIRNELVTE